MTPARHAALSAQGWHDIYAIWTYLSSDFRWVIPAIVIYALIERGGK